MLSTHVHCLRHGTSQLYIYICTNCDRVFVGSNEMKNTFTNRVRSKTHARSCSNVCMWVRCLKYSEAVNETRIVQFLNLKKKIKRKRIRWICKYRRPVLACTGSLSRNSSSCFLFFLFFSRTNIKMRTHWMSQALFIYSDKFNIYVYSKTKNWCLLCLCLL